MANVFKREIVTSTSAGSTIYTVPASTSTVVIGLMATNIAGSLDFLSIDINSTTYLAKDIPIPSGSAAGFVDGKLVLLAGDTLNEMSGVDGSMDIVLSYMEIA